MNGYGTSPVELMAADAMLRGEIYCESFVYSADYTGGSVLGASATVDVQVQINSDSDFVIQEWNLVSNTAADTPEVDPDYRWNLVVAGSGRQIFNRSQHVSNILGNFRVNLPGGSKMTFPRLVQSNTTLTSTLQNLSATASTFAQISLIGFKVFYTGGNRQQIFHIT